MIKDKDMKFWIDNNLNVLMKGKHGVGKTTMILEAFEAANLNWKYFSAATMDPWVDFIGIPKERNENGKSYLDLVRPKEFSEDTVEALFFDEFNRAPKKVRNAVMELIQFKSINGKKFKNLKIVWAAINPDDDDEDYDVEKLDPAQLDRFQVHVEIPYKPNYSYFSTKFGKAMATNAIEWWNAQGIESKAAVSPRRLDYAVDMYKIGGGGSVKSVLPKVANVQHFIESMEQVAIESEMDSLKEMSKEDKINKFKDENFYSRTIVYLEKRNLMNSYMPYFPKEKIAALATDKSSIFHALLREESKNLTYKEVLDGIIDSALDETKSDLITLCRNKGYDEALEHYSKSNVTYGRNVTFNYNWPVALIKGIQYKNTMIKSGWSEASIAVMRKQISDLNNFQRTSYRLPLQSRRNNAYTTTQRKALVNNSVKFYTPYLTLASHREVVENFAVFLRSSQENTVVKTVAANPHMVSCFNYSLEVVTAHTRPENFKTSLPQFTAYITYDLDLTLMKNLGFALTRV